MSFIKYFLIKDLKLRYAGSGIGSLWAILTPLLQILIFWFVFSEILKTRAYIGVQIPYIYFLLSSIFFWFAFSEGVFRASNAIIDNRDTIKKVAFPYIILPLTVTISAYILNMVGFILFFVVFMITTSSPSPVMLLIIPVLIMQFLFSLGLGMSLSAISPYIRDIGQILGPLMQGIFFMTPIIYSIESVPKKFQIIFYLNPLTYFISSYQKILLLNEIPPVNQLATIFLLSISSLFGGFYIFKKLKDGFADVL